MQVSAGIQAEAVFLGISVLVGAGLFLLYDVLRIFRRIIPHGAVWIGVEDFFYWLICTGVVFVMLYLENDGMVRGFALGGVMLGMLLYFLVFSRFIIKINVLVWKKILGIIQKILHILLHPFYKIGKKILHFFWKQLKKAGKAIRMGLCKL